MVGFNISDIVSENDNKNFKLATVTTISENGTAKVTFYGEDAESQKEFSYLSSYEPEINDVVLLISFADTYIIIGSVYSYATAPKEYLTPDEIPDALSGFITADELSEVLSNYAKQDDLNGYSTTDHRHSNLYSTSTTYGNSVVYECFSNFDFSFHATSGGISTLGDSSNKWKAVYSSNGTIQTSDLRKKTDVNSISDKYEELFMLLKPITYKLNENTAISIGYGAQDVEAA
jgi:hypothetical protein